MVRGASLTLYGGRDFIEDYEMAALKNDFQLNTFQYENGNAIKMGEGESEYINHFCCHIFLFSSVITRIALIN